VMVREALHLAGKDPNKPAFVAYAVQRFPALENHVHPAGYRGPTAERRAAAIDFHAVRPMRGHCRRTRGRGIPPGDGLPAEHAVGSGKHPRER